jgi:hypothetical protein
MQTCTISPEEFSEKAHALYEHDLRPKVEIEENIGKLIIFDVSNAHYEIDDDLLKASARLRDRYPDTNVENLFTIRIGYDAVYTIGGTLTRTTNL